MTKHLKNESERTNYTRRAKIEQFTRVVLKERIKKGKWKIRNDCLKGWRRKLEYI